MNKDFLKLIVKRLVVDTYELDYMELYNLSVSLGYKELSDNIEKHFIILGDLLRNNDYSKCYSVIKNFTRILKREDAIKLYNLGFILVNKTLKENNNLEYRKKMATKDIAIKSIEYCINNKEGYRELEEILKSEDLAESISNWYEGKTIITEELNPAIDWAMLQRTGDIVDYDNHSSDLACYIGEGKLRLGYLLFTIVAMINDLALYQGKTKLNSYTIDKIVDKVNDESVKSYYLEMYRINSNKKISDSEILKSLNNRYYQSHKNYVDCLSHLVLSNNISLHQLVDDNMKDYYNLERDLNSDMIFIDSSIVECIKNRNFLLPAGGVILQGDDYEIFIREVEKFDNYYISIILTSDSKVEGTMLIDLRNETVNASGNISKEVINRILTFYETSGLNYITNITLYILGNESDKSETEICKFEEIKDFEVVTPYYWRYKGKSNINPNAVENSPINAEKKIVIEAFVRKLPKGGIASLERQELAKRRFINLKEGYTIVDRYERTIKSSKSSSFSELLDTYN